MAVCIYFDVFAVARNNARAHYFLPLGLRFLAVLAASLKFEAVGAPFEPGFRIFSPDPAAIRFFFAAMFAYKPRFLGMVLAVGNLMLLLFDGLFHWFFLLSWATAFRSVSSWSLGHGKPRLHNLKLAGLGQLSPDAVVGGSHRLGFCQVKYL